jgi:hypothetical protein
LNSDKSDKIKQTGGTVPEKEDKFNIPEYKELFNNPMLPNEQRRIYNENLSKKPVEKKSLIDFSFKYDPPKKQQQNTNMRDKPYPNPAVFYPNYQPNPFNPQTYANFIQQTNYGMPTHPAQPVFNEYNITIQGVSGSHLRTQMLFQDVLPVKNVLNSFCSIEERRTMYDFIRANLFDKGDGTDVAIENNTYNLLSYLKLMDMNPYSAARYTNNPYKGLPFGLLLFRSCYPIRHDTFHNTSSCSPNSTGINIRIYRLTEGAYYVNKQDVSKTVDYDEWRDIFFYNYVKEHIIKPKICPHFPFMYGYHITINSNINFDELKQIQTNSIAPTNTPQILGNPVLLRQNVVPPHLANRNTSLLQQPAYNRLAPSNTQTNTQIRIPTIVPNSQIQPVAQPATIDLNKYIGKVIVCLTEACNYTILGWAKKEYRSVGNVKTMINMGYHTKNVWLSIYFQIFYTLHVMQTKGIVIDKFRLDRNVFIKDIGRGGPNTQFWKYKINGIEYFIPNFGYLVIIDTNYRDFDYPYTETIPNTDVHKLDGMFIDTFRLNVQSHNKIFDMFKTASDPNIYNADFAYDHGVKPSEEVISILTNIKNDADAQISTDISVYIRKHMTMFIHNRVGGVLTEPEKNNIKRGGVRDFRKGQIVVMLDGDGEEKFVVHIQSTNGIAQIITKDKLDLDTANIIEKSVNIMSLNEYSVLHPIKQNNKYDANFNDDMLLETYTC